MIDRFIDWAATYQGQQMIAMIVIAGIFWYVYLVWRSYIRMHENHDDASSD